MPKRPVSVTLDVDNLLWLKARAVSTKRRSLSDELDRLIAEARLRDDPGAATIRSVVGTVDINPDDPGLESADEYVRALFDASSARPILVKERPPQPGRTGTRRARRHRG